MKSQREMRNLDSMVLLLLVLLLPKCTDLRFPKYNLVLNQSKKHSSCCSSSLAILLVRSETFSIHSPLNTLNGLSCTIEFYYQPTSGLMQMLHFDWLHY